ncbi:MAG TPA: flavin reductase family protein [Solirubrobacteraceae bacterium]|nr:flavin reductase family protein [Solirubrobacteraceae bacterium]
MAELDYPMLLVTTRAAGELDGCLVGFSTQCSIRPPRFLVGLSDKNRTFRAARQAEALAVHLVPAGAEELAELFGGETQDEVDKFARCRWRPGPGDLPILEDCPNWFAGRILERLALGDHVGFVLEPFAVSRDDRDPGFISFQQVRRMEPGHEA